MKKKFNREDWEAYIPIPVFEEHPEYAEFYKKAWELAYAHIKEVPGMPQSVYMDEAFCETQIWIWDSCFMALFCKYAQKIFPGIETLDNFYQVLYGGKKLAKVIPPERELEWTGTLPGVPYEIHINIADNPPLFAWAEYENALLHGNTDYIKELLYKRKVLQKHYVWIENLCESVLPEGVSNPTCLIAEKIGYRWEGGRSGMDNTPRGRITAHAISARPNNPNMFWIDAICQQALSARTIAKLYGLIKDNIQEAKWIGKYEEKKKIVNQFYWDDEDRFYYDIDCNTHRFYKIMTIASYWAMTAGIASKEQAENMAQHISNPETFGGFVPLVSLSRSDNDYKSNGEYWRGSVWLPTAYAALKGLKEYGFFQEAHVAGSRLLEHMYQTYVKYMPHTIWECYSPEEYKPACNETGKEIVRPDFCGWSALGPIAIYIEYVLGFHSINAFEKVVEWAKPNTIKGKVGIKNLQFGDVVTTIMADEKICVVTSNREYTLKINGKSYKIHEGKNEFDII